MVDGGDRTDEVVMCANNTAKKVLYAAAVAVTVYTVSFSRLPLHRFVQERLTLRFTNLLL